MRFVKIDRLSRWSGSALSQDQRPIITLSRNTWNDYGFKTLFRATAHNVASGGSVDMGDVKIVRRGQSTKDATYSLLPDAFDSLDREYCSLGQSLAFYQTLSELGHDFAIEYSEAMNDAALSADIRNQFEQEEAFRVSALRTSNALDALENAAALFGQAEPAKVDAFEIRTRLPGAEHEHRLSFDFRPHNGLPHRVSVLVGLNGVGKTALMARLAMLVTRFESSSKEQQRTAVGQTFEDLGEIIPRPSLYTVIAVSFSAFDDFEIPRIAEGDKYRYVYCGLRRQAGGIRDVSGIAERVHQLVLEMSDAQRTYLSSILPQIIQREDIGEFVANPTKSRALYASLSAGQRIALNIISELLVSVTERSLVLLDEPEVHLHPQLLSTLMAILGDILTASNSFAIVATHSPIVVQQVPSRSVLVMRRMAGRPLVNKPAIECFGENLTEIVRTVFEAVESDRSYEQVIDQLLEETGGDAETVEAIFDNKLGMNARLYLHSRSER